MAPKPAGGKAKRALRAPAPARPRRGRQKKGRQEFKPVECETGQIVKGGCLKQPVYLPTLAQDGELFVKLHLREQWLCNLVAGKSHGLDPLSRTSLIRHLREAVMESHGSSGEPGSSAPAVAEEEPGWPKNMVGFGLDADQSGASASLQGVEDGPPLQMAQKRAPKSKKPIESTVLDARISPRLREVAGGKRTFRALTRPKGAALGQGCVWVAKGELDWILPALRKQLASGGVEFQPEPTSLGLYFSVRDLSWNARARDLGGQVRRRSFAVSRWVALQDGRRRAMSREEFKEMRETVRQEAQDWMEEVQGC